MNHILIIDNSYSMTQKSTSRLTFLEIAKRFAEAYITTRMKMPETKGDKYFIFHTDKESKRDITSYVMVHDIPHILETLRGIVPSYNCDIFLALKSSLDFLNAFRITSQADNYFGGRDVIKAENSNVSFFLL
jgi:hypothetical protein